MKPVPERTRGAPAAPRPLPIALVCAGCGYRVPDEVAFIARCPRAAEGDDVDHVLRRELRPSVLAFPGGSGPGGRVDGAVDLPTFVRYRALSRAYHVARSSGGSDADFVDLAGRLDGSVAAVDGHGFRETPFEPATELGRRLGMDGGAVWVKDETENVSGSHKGRHLMGILLELLVAEAGRTPLAPADTLETLPRLAIASCGNAALAAAVVARAAGRPLDVFVPTWADAPVLARLRTLDAEVITCPRAPGEDGDPTYHRLKEAVAAGAIPFTCQGSENGLAIEGGQTLGYEMVSRLARGAAARAGRDGEPSGVLDAVVVQVGGGALASAVAAAFHEARLLGAIAREPRLYAVQTEGCAPLQRAWRRFAEDAASVGVGVALEHARGHRSAYMRPWETEPASAAHGILDDETYDWLAIVEAMARTGGRAVVVDEAAIEAANELGRATTGIDADHTGTAGLAGLLTLLADGDVRPDENVAVLFTGVLRRDDPPGAAVTAVADHSRPMESSTR